MQAAAGGDDTKFCAELQQAEAHGGSGIFASATAFAVWKCALSGRVELQLSLQMHLQQSGQSHAGGNT